LVYAKPLTGWPSSVIRKGPSRQSDRRAMAHYSWAKGRRDRREVAEIAGNRYYSKRGRVRISGITGDAAHS
jgi:hypothetical protein